MNLPNPSSFILCEKLGKGTNATVYRAYRKNNSSEVVAIKCIDKKALNKAASDNLVSEITILKEVKHENIVQMLDFTWDSKYIYLILEYCASGDLSSYLRLHKILPENTVRRFLQQLSMGLKELFSRSILHMDLKPQNILLQNITGRYRLKIADFGFAKCIEADTVQMKYLRGSLLYMAPEVYQAGLYSVKCDLWSVGVILYECLYGKAPFYSTTLEELKEKIVANWEISIPNSTEYPDKTCVEISDECQKLLMKLLQRDVDLRISQEDFFIHPYLDLEHAPSCKSKLKAEELLEKSRSAEEIWSKKYEVGNCDRLRNSRLNKWTELERIYQEKLDGLTHLVAALQYEIGESTRYQLKEKLSNEMERAELLKLKLDLKENNKKLEENGSKVLLKQLSEDSLDLPALQYLSKENPQIQYFLNHLRIFYDQVDKRQYTEAIRTFTDCFQDGYTAIKNLPKSKEKELCFKEMECSMSLAENVKQLLSTKNGSIEEVRRKSVSPTSNSDTQLCIIS